MEGVNVSELTDYLWQSADLSYKLHETQIEIRKTLESTDANEIAILASRQLGKSYGILSYAIEYCLLNPGSIVRVLASTLKQVQDIVQDNLGPICLDAPPGLIERQKSSYRWRVGKSSLRLGPLERAYVDYNRGGNASLIICEEGGFVPSGDYEYAVRSVIGPQLLRSGGRLIHVTTPSEDPLHYIHTEVVPKCQLMGSLFTYTIYDNPQLTIDQIEKAKSLCGGEHTAAWKREYLAQVIRDPSLMIIPSFSVNRHVKKLEFLTDAHWQIAMDTGGTRDKTVGLLYTYDYLRNKILIMREFVCEPNTSTSDIVKEALKIEAEVPVISSRFADVSGQVQIDLNLLHKYQVTVPIKDDWQAGINNMQVIFEKDQIEIDESCRFLITSLESGQYNKKRNDFARTEALGHCDALAALMYGLRMVDKSSPYQQSYLSRSVMFQRPKTESLDIVGATVPKSFTNSKRFGGFK